MTKPRADSAREIYGLLGRWKGRTGLLLSWNQWFKEQQIDAALVHYSADTDTLPERLSEMWHFDRRLYLVDEALQSAIIPLLDEASGQVSVNVVFNDAGILRGRFEPDLRPQHLLATLPALGVQNT